MCIPHGATMPTSNGYAKEKKPKKHIEKVSQDQFEKGDPDFVDERKTEDESKNKKQSFFESLFS
ncbi:MAG: hypothetical protein L3J19_01860 [Sulfurimonas sp.]|nr:hypothetical protein [Sulfurimonas sp.]